MGVPNKSVNWLLVDAIIGYFSETELTIDEFVVKVCALFNDLSLEGITPDALDFLVSLPEMFDLLYLLVLMLDVCCLSSIVVVDLVVAELDSLVTYNYKENIQLNTNSTPFFRYFEKTFKKTL
jgi:hypothetical protein